MAIHRGKRTTDTKKIRNKERTKGPSGQIDENSDRVRKQKGAERKKDRVDLPRQPLKKKKINAWGPEVKALPEQPQEGDDETKGGGGGNNEVFVTGGCPGLLGGDQSRPRVGK